MGFCGKKEEHKCQSHFLVTIGEGVVGYEIITDAFKNCVVGHYECGIFFRTYYWSFLKWEQQENNTYVEGLLLNDGHDI